MVLIIDNYDSFSYNLVQIVGNLNPDIRIIRNDAMTCEEIEKEAPTHIILSPGPGRPADAGICEEAIAYFQGKVPILGVCLGHQAICEVFGAKIIYAKELQHGKQSQARIDNLDPIFQDLEDTISVARYHSLAAEESSIPACLRIIARTEDGEVMAVSHVEDKIFGLQFHPESILTESGEQIIRNFLNQ
ncbi:anthranilate synthase component II [Parasporobacterium paucivorans]|uniref:Anthranilate synthase component 2 n=1 Tax=Parasporobacterium paucivorans DSM 15970 TaxID=1122934 RepID=A0A1M6IG32_9FIRM|nr:aminodeoxychorismate/anthranilate synthase component II [Parasporobacterium paucivorans]SHJ33388.1 anthranilate synthase component 2 [Parasporobacterium paucivorans DSM 15970]